MTTQEIPAREEYAAAVAYPRASETERLHGGRLRFFRTIAESVGVQGPTGGAVVTAAVLASVSGGGTALVQVVAAVAMGLSPTRLSYSPAASTAPARPGRTSGRPGSREPGHLGHKGPVHGHKGPARTLMSSRRCSTCSPTFVTRPGVSYLLISHDLGRRAPVHRRNPRVAPRHGRRTRPTARVLDNPQYRYSQRLRASIPRPGWKPSRGWHAA